MWISISKADTDADSEELMYEFITCLNIPLCDLYKFTYFNGLPIYYRHDVYLTDTDSRLPCYVYHNI